MCHILVPDDPRCVIVKKLALVVDDRPEMEMDLSGTVPLSFVWVTTCNTRLKHLQFKDTF